LTAAREAAVQAAHHIVAVAGPVGGGKSTLVEGLAGRLTDASVIRFDHYERVTEQPIENIRRWMESGADLDELVIAGLPEDLRALKQGYSVVDPLTQAPIPARKYVLFECQFGRQHKATGQHIDFLIWIDTPLDVALARKVRAFSGELRQARERKEIDGFAPWLHAYLDNYLEVVGGLLRMQRETVGANADLVIDGSGTADAVLNRAEREIRARLR
jgi:uridine kinase